MGRNRGELVEYVVHDTNGQVHEAVNPDTLKPEPMVVKLPLKKDALEKWKRNNPMYELQPKPTILPKSHYPWQDRKDIEG